jgi:tetratricopeptide (TPR) repeat protein
MTASFERRHSAVDKQHTENDIRANSSEAARLYQRGVAAARAGQRRVAAGFLTRSVQLDPRNEGAWLWLSGVLDDPHQVAFCLNSVLKLNPASERARRGLRWLEEQKMLKGKPAASPLSDIRVEEPASERTARETGESWWVNWRQLVRDSRRVTLMWWAIPVIILGIALVIHQSFVLAVARDSQPPMIPTPPASDTSEEAVMAVTMILTPTATLTTTAEPVLEAEPGSIRESETIGYLHQIKPLRQDLRDAVDTYRSTTGRPGGSLSHLAAAQTLRESIQDAYNSMQGMDPPTELQQAHQEYMKGLEVELMAIDDLLEFYGSYRVELANRAALRFQEANEHFDRARAMFDTRLQQIEDASTVPNHTVR